MVGSVSLCCDCSCALLLAGTSMQWSESSCIHRTGKTVQAFPARRAEASIQIFVTNWSIWCADAFLHRLLVCLFSFTCTNALIHSQPLFLSVSLSLSLSHYCCLTASQLPAVGVSHTHLCPNSHNLPAELVAAVGAAPLGKALRGRRAGIARVFSRVPSWTVSQRDEQRNIRKQRNSGQYILFGTDWQSVARSRVARHK